MFQDKNNENAEKNKNKQTNQDMYEEEITKFDENTIRGSSPYANFITVIFQNIF